MYSDLFLDNNHFQVVRVAFFAEGADAEEARAAGADIVGGIELVEEIASNKSIRAAADILSSPLNILS